MRNNVVATYTHTDREVRFLLRYTLVTGLAAGIVIGGLIHAVIN